MPLKRYKNLDDIPKSAPVFPLNGALLLPRGQLPLNIFESRYVEMIDYCLAHDRTVVIVQPDIKGLSNVNTVNEASESPEGNPPLAKTGCLARLTGYMETEVDRYLITLTGISRVHLETEQNSRTSFRQFNVSADNFSNDLTEQYGADEVDREKVISILRKYVEANDLEIEWESIGQANNEELINSLAMISPFGPLEKQALLEAETLKIRSDLLIAFTEKDLSENSMDHHIILQ